MFFKRRNGVTDLKVNYSNNQISNISKISIKELATLASLNFYPKKGRFCEIVTLSTPSSNVDKLTIFGLPLKKSFSFPPVLAAFAQIDKSVCNLILIRLRSAFRLSRRFPVDFLYLIVHRGHCKKLINLM